MLFVYLDEFGHIGPYVSRTAEIYNESPVFGLAGIILPDSAVRPFATKFLQIKQHLFSAEIARAGGMAAKWEKKGKDIFRPRALEKYAALRSIGFRLLSTIEAVGGNIFYHGREKVIGKTDGDPNGLYKTVLSRAIRKLDDFCATRNENFVLIVDEHSARKVLLECASKTMFGNNPARRLVSPPFEVESYLNQNIQAADWVATIVGRLWMHQLQGSLYSDHAKLRAYYWERVHRITSHSSVFTRRPPRSWRASTTITSVAVTVERTLPA